MKYQFPIIEHIDQVLPLVKDRKEFVVSSKYGYTTINYLLSNPEVFPDVETEEHVIYRECRGIAFDDKTGKIISRPFHKFFNLGEREETRNIGDKVPAYVTKKLDGSMIRPLYLEYGTRLGTKMGVTDIAMQAEEFIADKPNFIEFIEGCRLGGYTPIFEWCSRQNQIIIDYPEPSLTLLAIRDTISGDYLSKFSLDLVDKFNIPVIQHVEPKEIDKVAEETKTETGNEGYVLVFENGHRVKIKSDWYVLLHKSKELISREKDLLKLILTDQLDDLKPLLVDDDLKAVEQYEIRVALELEKTTNAVVNMYECFSCPDRKDFALTIKEKASNNWHSILFKMYDGKDTMEAVKEQLLKACSSGPKLEEARWMIGGVRFEGNVMKGAA